MNIGQAFKMAWKSIWGKKGRSALTILSIFIGIAGGTGSGKTTFCNLIPRFYDATSGQVLVDGVDVKDYAFDALYDKLGYVTQKAVLFSGSIRDNIFFGESAADADDGALSSAIELSQAKEFVDKLPEGTEHHIAQLGRNVSGGQKQRLSIACGALSGRSVLIFDEPTSGLDGGNMRIISGILRTEAAAGKTVLVITHDQELMRSCCDCAVRMENTWHGA